MKTRLAASLVLSLPLLALVAAPVAASGSSAGAVYTLSNSSSGNAVIAYARSNTGALTSLGSFPTGGLGSGSGLGSQGAVTLSDDGRWLLAVDAGSDEISAFEVGSDHRLTATDRIWSGGDHPISVTISGSRVYAANDGGDGNIAGFSISASGDLAPITGSIRPLSSTASGPAQISFTPAGTALVVTEKATDRITTYQVASDGAAGSPQSVPSAGATPFGFEFDNQGHLIVSEAFGGAPDASAVSSYSVASGSASLIDGPVPTTETAACWVVVSGNGKYAYASNTGSGSISGYAVSRNGDLALLDADGVTGVTGGGPTDMSISANSKFLYARVGGSIVRFSIGKDGSLTNGGTTVVQGGIVGLASV